MKSATQKATVQEKRSSIARQIWKWRQAQSVYMPGALAPPLPTHDDDADEDYTEDSDLPENIPLVFPSEVEPTRRRMICLHRVAEHEHELRLAQIHDSLIELCNARRIRYTLLMNHQMQIAGQGQRIQTRSRSVVSTVEERISKFTQRYRAAYNALQRLDPTGAWQHTYLELKDEDNRGPGKEDEERGPGDGSYTISWIWLVNPRAHGLGDGGTSPGEDGASDEEVNDVMRVQWTTAHARLERWTEEVELLQEEMRRVVVFLEWKSGDWWAKQDVRSATTSPEIRSGLQAYARKQASIHHDLAVSFSNLWLPALHSSNLEYSWITEFLEQRKFPPSDTNIGPTTPAQGTSGTSETDGNSSRIDATPHVQHQGPSNTHVEGADSNDSDDSSDDDLDDNPDNPSDSDDDDDGDDDFDFGFGWS